MTGALKFLTAKLVVIPTRRAARQRAKLAVDSTQEGGVPISASLRDPTTPPTHQADKPLALTRERDGPQGQGEGLPTTFPGLSRSMSRHIPPILYLYPGTGGFSFPPCHLEPSLWPHSPPSSLACATCGR